jgi:hypothetical protein
MKLSNLIKQPNQSFASVLLAFSLFGFLWPHHANSANGRQHVNMIQQSEAQPNDDWSNGWYTPPRSPGFHQDFGS